MSRRPRKGRRSSDAIVAATSPRRRHVLVRRPRGSKPTCKPSGQTAKRKPMQWATHIVKGPQTRSPTLPEPGGLESAAMKNSIAGGPEAAAINSASPMCPAIRQGLNGGQSNSARGLGTNAPIDPRNIVSAACWAATCKVISAATLRS